MYSPAVTTVCYYFLSKDVAAERVSPLIVSCIDNLTYNSISLVDLPFASCINTQNLGLGNISRQQISYGLESETILRDGTKRMENIFMMLKCF